jgi:hypothetical protein
MGGLAPAANILSSALGLAGMGMDLYSAAQDRRDSSRLAAAQRQAIQSDANAAAADLRRRRQEERRTNQAALRRAVAQRRARLASAGVPSSTGSGEALLRGLVNEAHLARDALDRETEAQVETIRLNAAQGLRTNLLRTNSANRQSFIQQLATGLPRFGTFLEDL